VIDMPPFDPSLPTGNPVMIDAAEFAALSVVVRAIVATMANQLDQSNVGAGQRWINAVSAACQQAILTADIAGTGDVEAFKGKTLEHVNRILDGLGPPYSPGNTGH
jgi:hypothetical protein